MLNKNKIFMAMSVLMISGSLWAAEECKVTFLREPCPGKSKESFEKCQGQAQCTITMPEAKSEVECLKVAFKSCENKRLKETKSKVVTATWGDKKLKDGHDFCNPKAADFNKCD